MIEIQDDYNGLKKTKKTKYNIKKINKILVENNTNYIYNCVLIIGVGYIYMMLK